MDWTQWTDIPFEKLKCFELVSAVFQARGIAIGDYRDPGFAAKWERVARAALEPGDLVHLDLPDAEFEHVGLYAGDGMFLHTMERIGSRLSRLEIYGRFVRGCYRWRG